jgi:sugar/nucleoside kinase (ribokinase family)
MSLLVVGSVALDSIETPFASHKDVLGGSASFFSVVASALTPVRMVAVVGDDFPEEHVDFFRQREVDVEGLQRVEGRTFRWSGRYHENMVDRDTLDTQLNVFQDFKPVLPDAYRESEYIFLANIDPKLQLQVLEQVRNPKFVACDTMNFWLQGETLESFRKVLASTHAVFVNDEEARLLSGEHNLVKAAAAIRKMGVERVIVKRGDAGAQLHDDDGIFIAPAFPLEGVADPTGAGDSFAGGFVSYIANRGRLDGATLRQAMVFGTATASFSVEAFSLDRFKTLDLPQVLDRCAKYGELVRFDPISL